MEQKIAIIGIFVKDLKSVSEVNTALHAYADKIIGRMGLPHTDAGVNVISVIISATSDEINSLSGKLGKIPNVSAKAMQAKI